jgi:hypothetical protein
MGSGERHIGLKMGSTIDIGGKKRRKSSALREEIMANMTPIEKFFGGKFNNFVKKYKWVLFFSLSMWSVVSLVTASKIGPLTSEESFLPDGHWAKTGQKMATEGYNTGDEDLSIDITIYWGVKGINKEGIDQWNPKDMGKIRWDMEFDISLETS